MRVMIIALLAAISYAQTAPETARQKKQFVGAGRICEDLPPTMCSGPGEVAGRICMLDRRENPPQCIEGRPADPEDVCASYYPSECTNDQRCCVGIEGFCVKNDPEDCPALNPIPMAGVGGFSGFSGGFNPSAGTVDIPTGSTVNTNPSTVDTASSTGITVPTGNIVPSTGAFLPLLQAGDVGAALSNRVLTMACDALTLQGAAVCNTKKVIGGRICVWDVRESKCADTQPAYGNLCQAISDGPTCNGYRDCCWDVERYCDEIDGGDCPGRASPQDVPMAGPSGGVMVGPGMTGGRPMPGMGAEEMAEAAEEAAEAHAEAQQEFGPQWGDTGGAGVLPIMNGGVSGQGGASNGFFGPTSVGGSGGSGLPESMIEGHQEAHSEMAEASSEAAEQHAEFHSEVHEEIHEAAQEHAEEIGMSSIPLVASCTGLTTCYGRVGLSLCITDPTDGKCKVTNYKRSQTSNTPLLRRPHKAESTELDNKAFEFGLLAVGIVFGFLLVYCWRSKGRQEDILLDEYQAA